MLHILGFSRISKIIFVLYQAFPLDKADQAPEGSTKKIAPFWVYSVGTWQVGNDSTKN